MIALRSPMHALVWKEWRTLRNIRWAGVVMGALLPVCFIAGAELSRQGWAPLGSSASYSVTDILREAIPAAFAFGLWPLIAVILVAQSLGGDRAAGTETFLLERPVSRRRIWAVRILVCLVSIATVIAVTGGLWASWYLLGGKGNTAAWMQPIKMFQIGGLFVLTAMICGTLGSAILSPPILAILGSAVLMAVPLVLSAVLARLFPFALIGGIPTGLMVTWIIVPLYLVASYVATCTGEPAGRGRRARGLGTLALGVLATLFFFVSSAQAVLRWQAAHPDVIGDLIPSPGGERLLLSRPFGGNVWLVDTTTLSIPRHCPMPCYGAFWRGDGTMSAVITSAGPLGSEGRLRISFFDRDGQPSSLSWYGDSGNEGSLRVDWDGDLAVFKVLSSTKGRLVFFQPGKGETAVIPVPTEGWSWDYVGKLWDGSPAIWKLMPGEKEGSQFRSNEQPIRKRYGLYRVSSSAGTIDPEPLIIEHGFPLGRRQMLSPSGRWWRRDRMRSEPKEMVDLATGRVVPATRGGWPDDPVRYFVQEDGKISTLVEEHDNGLGRTLQAWSDADVALARSPKDRYLLVRVTTTNPSLHPHRAAMTERWLYEIESGAWRALPVPRDLAAVHTDVSPSWVGPTLLAWSWPGMLALQDVEAPDRIRYVVDER